MLGRFVLNMKPENVSATKVFDRGIDLLNDELCKFRGFSEEHRSLWRFSMGGGIIEYS